ncbi:uncharacterized protein LY89DRAFT_742204 [Mollisia scopiformis]|uniref:Uncharacterized protein n=1 Tax=Mollisia scopiformis TaxID=149040 RepID=A0A132B7I6_MOLSC|nr:uncharacterized protein LY89DRAFT_742204 [Mollisia scopiformis]KUJ08370.1 hypothetical protein LY89DRAFT_742204 [Mollisia scopiformis]
MLSLETDINTNPLTIDHKLDIQAYKIPYNIITMVCDLLESAKGSQPSKLLECLEKDLTDSAQESLASTSTAIVDIDVGMVLTTTVVAWRETVQDLLYVGQSVDVVQQTPLYSDPISACGIELIHTIKQARGVFS